MIREPGLFKEVFTCTEMLCLCSRVVGHTAAMTSPLINLNLAVKVATSAYWNRAATDRWRSIGVLNEKVNVTSNNRGFRTNNHSVATYEQVKKRLSYFHPKRIVESDGIHTQPLNLLETHSFFFHNFVYLSNFIHSN